MKIILSDKTELQAKRVCQNIVNDSEYISITLSDATNIESVSEKSESFGSFDIKREIGDTITYSGYTYDNVSRNVSDDSDDVTVTLRK